MTKEVSVITNFDDVVIFKHLIGGINQDVIHLRNLYKWIGLEATQYSRWCNTNLKEFDPEQEFTTLTTPLSRLGVEPLQKGETIVTLDTAKEMCMMARTERGKLYRKYLIQRDKDLANAYQKFSAMDEEAATEYLIEVAQARLALIRENKALIAENTILLAVEEVYNENMVLLMDWINAKFSVRVKYPDDISIGRLVSYKYVSTFGRRARKKSNAYYYPVSFLESKEDIISQHLVKLGYKINGE